MELLRTIAIVILAFNILIWSVMGLIIFVKIRRFWPELIAFVRTVGLNVGLSRIAGAAKKDEAEEVKKINEAFDRQAAERAAAAAAGKKETIQVMNADAMAEEFVMEDERPVNRSLTKQ